MKWIDEVVDGDRHGDHEIIFEENEKMQLEKTMEREKTMQLAEKNKKRRTRRKISQCL